jgi:FtsZ-binding cell division protein ZapB
MKKEAEIKLRRRNARNHWFTAVWMLLMCIPCVLFLGAAASDETFTKTQNAKTAIEKWIETQRIISQEKRDLALSREMLNERISLVQREIESLRNKTDEAQASIAETDKKRDAMVEENETLKQATASLGGVLSNMEGRVRHLIVRLPEPIRQRIKPLSQRLPNNSEQTNLSTAERFQNIVGILNELDKFNREISVTSEVRTLADNSSVEVAVLYLGLGQAFYTSSNASVAGTGTASDTAWVWKPNNPAAAQIADAIAIFKNEKVASFVQVPVEIK